jgi:DNA polymerase (family X)
MGPKLTNREIARIFDHIADILQFKDENPFKVRAYRQAANSIYHLDEDLHYLHEKDRLDEIPGVGKAIKGKFEEMLTKGSCEYYETLLREVPEGLFDMLAIPGVGFKTIKTLYEKLGISNREELLLAARENRIRNLPGMGSKTEYSVIKGIEMLERASDKNTLGFVLPMAEDLLEYLRGCPQVLLSSLAGSIRRGKPLVTDIDILAASAEESAVRNYASRYRYIKKIEVDEPGHLKGRLQFDIPFEVIIVTPEGYYAGLLLATGSKEHLQHLLQEQSEELLVPARSESEIYQRLGMDYIPPELREDQGELEAAAQSALPQLVEFTDLQGDLHVHSGWSDGASQIQEMVEAARRLNYSYLAITDHSKSLAISGGLNVERLNAQGEEIDRLNRSWRDFMVFKGTEVDILRDGSLDYGPEVLRELDIVIASIHTNFHLDKEQQTARIVAAIKDENVDMIGHMSGRLLNRRPAYELDVERILEEAARNQVVLEINSHPDRLDIDAQLARKAIQFGIKVSINSDAHHRNDLNLVKYGVLNARRGWLEKKDVVNCSSCGEIKKIFKIKRER